MPDIGFLELIVIGVVAFLVLGPERMPELFGQVGRVVRKGRGWINDVRKQIDAESASLKNPLHEVEDSMKGGIEDYNAAIMKELGQSMPDDLSSMSLDPSKTTTTTASSPKPDKKQDDT